MKSVLSLFMTAFLSLGLSAAETSYAALQSGSEDWGKLLDVQDGRFSAPDEKRDAVERELFELGTKFFHQYPDDPRRWRAGVMALQATPQFYLESDPKKRGPSPGVDEAAVADWKKRTQALAIAIVEAPAAPINYKEQAAFSLISQQFVTLRKAGFKHEAVDWLPARQALEAHFAKYYDQAALQSILVERLRFYLMIAQYDGQEAFIESELRHFAEAPQKRIQLEAARQLAEKTSGDKPLEGKLATADGREIDLNQWRGKVVVFHFWTIGSLFTPDALASMRAYYDEYHSKGVEFIGVPVDPKLDRQRLLDFSAKNGAIWPQYFDEQLKGGELAVKFDVDENRLPTVMVLDREGRVAAKPARGFRGDPKLDVLLPKLVDPEGYAAAIAADKAQRDALRKQQQMAADKAFELKFTALDGREIDLSQWRGRVVVLDFWATWCRPCVASVPKLKEFYARYNPQGVEFIGVSLDSKADHQKVVDFCAQNGIPWPQYYDSKAFRGELVGRFDITGIPAFVIIDQTGRVVAEPKQGQKVDDELADLDAALSKLTNQRQASVK